MQRSRTIRVFYSISFARKMAPKRNNTTVATNSAAAAVTRVTRSSSRLANSAAMPPPPIADPKPRKRKKAITAPAPAPVTASEEETDVEEPPLMAEQDPVTEPEKVDVSKTIVVEHCKQCNSFKTRALQVKEGLEKDVQGVKVVVNPEKPRKGCFEVREEGGEVFISLLDMKRPFKPMKALNMMEVISKIVEKIR